MRRADKVSSPASKKIFVSAAMFDGKQEVVGVRILEPREAVEFCILSAGPYEALAEFIAQRRAGWAANVTGESLAEIISQSIAHNRDALTRAVAALARLNGLPEATAIHLARRFAETIHVAVPGAGKN